MSEPGITKETIGNIGNVGQVETSKAGLYEQHLNQPRKLKISLQMMQEIEWGHFFCSSDDDRVPDIHQAWVEVIIGSF